MKKIIFLVVLCAVVFLGVVHASDRCIFEGGVENSNCTIVEMPPEQAAEFGLPSCAEQVCTAHRRAKYQYPSVVLLQQVVCAPTVPSTSKSSTSTPSK